MRRVFGRGDFENVNYTVEEIDGKQTLVVLVKEKPERHYFRFGLELDADLGKHANFNLYASHRAKWLNSWGAEWRNDLVLGTNVLLGTEFYQPLGPRQYFFVAPQLRYAIDPWYLFFGRRARRRVPGHPWERAARRRRQHHRVRRGSPRCRLWPAISSSCKAAAPVSWPAGDVHRGASKGWLGSIGSTASISRTAAICAIGRRLFVAVGAGRRRRVHEVGRTAQRRGDLGAAHAGSAGDGRRQGRQQ